MPLLYVKCKGCSFEFPTGMAMDSTTFETSSLVRLEGNYHTCPNCGAAFEYKKGDYFFKEEHKTPIV